MTECFLFITFLIENHAKKFKKELIKGGWNINPGPIGKEGYESIGKNPAACVVAFNLTHTQTYNMNSVHQHMSYIITSLKLKVYSYLVTKYLYDARISASNFELPKHYHRPNKTTGIIPEYLKVVK